jgi:hypothetical protein
MASFGKCVIFRVAPSARHYKRFISCSWPCDMGLISATIGGERWGAFAKAASHDDVLLFLISR